MKKKKESQIFKLPRTSSEYEEITEWLDSQKNKSRSINLALLAMIKRYGNADLGNIMEKLFLESWSNNDSEQDSTDETEYHADRENEKPADSRSKDQHKDSAPKVKVTQKEGKKINPMDMLS